MGIHAGNRVAIEYTLRLEDGSIIESNVGEEAFEYTQGNEEIIPGLEQGLEGLEEGDVKEIRIPPELAYGEVLPEAFYEVDKNLVPPAARVVGTELVARDANGRERHVRVHEVHDETIVIDANHPLAGKTLIFDVRVLSVR
ncbi:MAG: FKBP-type peptidyl-prolyl cis-trans isomerase [Candidatus Binatia bacterium]|nr:FKBP-type peptidyl-prolyl cis-trans isomerase [Candidatus Binatia bacterium]